MCTKYKYLYFSQSLPNIHTLQMCALGSTTLEWGRRELWYAPETWLTCFQLATTTNTRGDDLTATGDGDTCKVETGLCFSTILTNLAFYPNYGVWISMAPQFEEMEGVIPLMQC